MRSWSALVPLALALSGCGSAESAPPGRIISNNPCVDAILADIAAPDQIGAVSIWSHDPASASAPNEWAQRYPAIGADAESIIAARPKLALIGAFGPTDALDRAGVRHLDFSVPATVDDSIAQVRQIGTAIGRGAEGEQLASAIARAAAPAGSAAKGRAIIWLSGGFVPGAGTLQDELIARAGYRNASAAYGLNQWDVLPLETLLRNPPDVIFTPLAKGIEGDRALALRHHVLARLHGRTRVVPFPDKLLNCGGPSIIKAMAVLRS